jgi:hypothetical protein
MPRPQFRLRSLFILTAIVAVGCWVGPPIAREIREVREQRSADRRRQAALQAAYAQRDASLQKTLQILLETVSDAPDCASPPTD